MAEFAKADELHRQKAAPGQPLRTLIDAEGGETAFGLYAEACCRDLTAALRGQSEKAKADGEREPNTYIGIFGHNGFAQSVAYAVATAAGVSEESVDEMIGVELGEGEGLLVPLYGHNRKVIHLKRPM